MMSSVSAVWLAAGAVLAVGTSAALRACWFEPRRLVMRRVEIASPAWPRGHGALRIALLSDFHAGGPHDLPARFARVVDRVNTEKPDLVLLLGDFADERRLKFPKVAPEALAAVLARLQAVRGVFAVLGNHDHAYGALRVSGALEAVGIPVLENRARRIELAGQSCWLVGAGDGHRCRDDLPSALAPIDDDAPIIVMTHSPDLFPRVPDGVVLAVAGHTHGGQVRLPLLGAPYVPSRTARRYLAGHFAEAGRDFYVTTGLGHSVLPVRFGVAPEVVLITLTGAGG